MHGAATVLHKKYNLTEDKWVSKRRQHMYLAVEPLAALVAGALILAISRLLNYIVAIYLIAIGVLGLVGR